MKIIFLHSTVMATLYMVYVYPLQITFKLTILDFLSQYRTFRIQKFLQQAVETVRHKFSNTTLRGVRTKTCEVGRAKYSKLMEYLVEECIDPQDPGVMSSHGLVLSSPSST